MNEPAGERRIVTVLMADVAGSTTIGEQLGSERAVRAALAAQDTLSDYAGQVSEAYGVVLAARFGINTGPVVLMDTEAPADERYNALGDTVNVAARLQAVAGEGGVAVGPSTARQIESRFALRSLGEVELT